ncbi:unnamed protein product [Rhizophagus irregularis]|nr:unnamed protein product [Rhizophagus irregularis]
MHNTTAHHSGFVQFFMNYIKDHFSSQLKYDENKDIDDGLDTLSESDKELFEIFDILLLKEKKLFEDLSHQHKCCEFTKENT